MMAPNTGNRLSAAFGSWAPRRFAAIEYPMRYIDRFPPPSGWERAALSLDFKAPDPFIRGDPRGDPVAIPTVSSAKARNIEHTTQDKSTEVKRM